MDNIEIDLVVDLNTMDDSGLPWAFFDEAIHPDRIVVGRFVVVGSGAARAVARIIDVEDGIVHVHPMRGSVSSNVGLLDSTPLAS
jgi:hypothetical protein